MRRATPFVIVLTTLSGPGAAIGACVSSNNASPTESGDGGPPGSDATLPSGGDDGAALDAPATDAALGADAGLDTGSVCAAVLAFDASTWDGGANSITSLTGGPLPGPAPSLCTSLAPHAPLLVLNDSPCPIEVWWVDLFCEEDRYATVAPGGSWYRDSHVSTSWRLRASGSEELLAEIAPLPAPTDDGGEGPLTIVSYPPSDAGAFDASAYLVEDEPDGAACINWDAAVEYDAAGWDGAPSPLEDDAGTIVGPPATTCSLVGDTPYEFMFVNDTGCPIDEYWVDYQCNELLYGTVPAQLTIVASTYETAVWRFRAHGSGELLYQAPIIPEGADAGRFIVRYP